MINNSVTMDEKERKAIGEIFDSRDESKEKILDLFQKYEMIDYKIINKELRISKPKASTHLVQLWKKNIIIKTKQGYTLNGTISQALGIGLRAKALEYDCRGIALIVGGAS